MPRGKRPFHRLILNGKEYFDAETTLDRLRNVGLSYAPTHIRHLSRTKAIPAERFRNRWYYPVDEVIAVLTGQPIEHRRTPDDLPTVDFI